MQDADDEDLPPLEEDVDEGSRMEVRCCAPRFACLYGACRGNCLIGKAENLKMAEKSRAMLLAHC